MATLKDARAAILAALEAAGVPAFYGFGKFSVPCARVFPAQPWIAADGLANGRCRQFWEVWAVTGRADAEANFDEMEALVSQIDAVLCRIPNMAGVRWSRPGVVTMSGVQYIACRGQVEALAEV